MCAIRHDDELIVRDQMRLQGREVGDVGDDAKICSTLRQCLDDFRTRPFFEIDRQVRIGCQEAVELLRQKRGQCGGVGQQPDAPPQTGRIGAQLAAHLFHLAEDQTGMMDERLARRRRAHTTTVTFEQWRTQGGLHTGDALANRGQRQVHDPRPVREAATLYHREEKPQVGQIETHALWLLVARIAILRICRSPAGGMPDCGDAAGPLGLRPCIPIFSSLAQEYWLAQ